MNLILFILGTIGLTNIIVDSSLFQPIRAWAKGEIALREAANIFIHPKFGKLLSCYQCCGVWAGWMVGLLLFSEWQFIFVAGFASSFLSELAAKIMLKLDN
jgi:hypothetical protein